MNTKINLLNIFRRSIHICSLVVLVVSFFAPISHAEASARLALSQISFVPNIETAGVIVSGTYIPLRAKLFYRLSGETAWKTGHDLFRIKDGRLVGSLFNLQPSTTYEVKVFDGANEILGSFTTQPEELSFTPANLIYVDANAPAGGDGSAVAPYQTIQEGVNRASPGTQVLVADGIYKESVTFPASGTAGNWIQVRAQGGGAVLDGSIPIAAESWVPYEGNPRIWSTVINKGIKYLAMDGLRLYQYSDLPALVAGGIYNKARTTDDGWFYDPATSTLYVRTAQQPGSYTWQLPRFNAAFMVDGRDWIWIEGFEMRFYGTGFGCGVCANNASNIVVRKNRIHNLQNPVFVSWTGGEDRGNNIRIEYNEMYDSYNGGEWTWNSQKGTAMESTAIVLRGHIGAIVRGNTIHHYFNGIYSSSSGELSNPGVAFDVDIYGNRLYSIWDDAFEPEGTAVNHRFRNNTVESMLVGVSLAPITMGPVWVVRNTFSGFTGRSVKWDRGSDGWVFMYHNTSWTNFAVPASVGFLRPVKNSILRNNIFQGTGYSVETSATGSTGHDWNYDNWYTTKTDYPFKWENYYYPTMYRLCAGTGLECSGHEEMPGLSNPAAGDFSLLAASPNINRGVLVPGINDAYMGSAPDIGAVESAYGSPTNATPTFTLLPNATATATSTPTATPTSTTLPPGAPPLVLAVFRTDPTPINTDVVHFGILFSKDVSGFDVSDLTLTATGNLANYAVTDVTGAGAAYVATVNTGTGDGTLQLSLTDNDSIVDGMSVPLGGVGIGNGIFIGESYLINKYAPFVTSVLRADPSPTSADGVHYLVTFSEPVTGVDAADFVLTVSGLSEAVVSSVVGFDNNYAVLVNTGSGSGSLRLDVVNDGSIVDAAGAPLNGIFNLGEMYEVDRNTPVIQSVTFYSDGKNDGWVLESKENSNRGGTLNANAVTLRLGDNAQNNQYRSILHFQTEPLPDNAVVTRMILALQLETVAGVNPFNTHRVIWVDMCQGAFGSFGPFQIGALQTSDFQAPASLYSAGIIQNNPVGDWYWVSFGERAFPYLNLKGGTQFRLGFLLDDDNDRTEDYISFFSGNYGVVSARPQLTVEYYVP